MIKTLRSRYAWSKSWHLLFVVFFLLLIHTTSFAQDFKRQYKHAKELFDERKYNLAMEAFKPLMVYDANNSYAEYASFFYSLSAYHQGYPEVAKDNLLQLKKLHPEWHQTDDVNYWLAKIYFDQRQYFQALLTLKAIKSASFISDLQALQRAYLTQIDDVETLKMILEENPTNAQVGYAMAKAISKQPIYQQDAMLFDDLVTKFNLNRDEFAMAVKPRSIKKDRYRVALLYPFLAQSFEPSFGVKSNQFVIDLYEGMKLAADTLSKQGFYLDLLAYDTERSKEVLEKLLKTDELRSTDLIVGPLLSEETKLVQEFSMTNQINMINPVTNNAAFMGENPFAMLYQPSFETLGKKSAEMLAQQVKNKNCMVFFGDSPKDSIMAFSFMRKALELGMKVVLAKEFTKESSVRIQPLLATATDHDDYNNPKEFKLKKDSIGSIFVASDDAVIYSKVISSVQTRGDSIVIVGTENWIANEASVNYDTFERLRITLAAPNYYNPHSPNYLAFRKKFMRKHGQLPTFYSRLGYEFVDFLGKSLSQHGVYFQDGVMQTGHSPGYMGMGYSFTNARDNQHVPFVRIKGGELAALKLN